MNVIWIICGVCAFIIVMMLMAGLGIIALLLWRRKNLKEKDERKQKIINEAEPDVVQPDTSKDVEPDVEQSETSKDKEPEPKVEE